jgi:hypothetical protein
MTTRKQRFKDLMRSRTIDDQGLTFNQIICEVYSDIVEKCIRNKYYDSTKSEFEAGGTNAIILMDSNGEYGKVRYLRRMIKQVRKTDDEVRWLSILSVKRNQVDKYGKKVRPYLEYRYINIKASQTPELLDEVNKFWERHKQACVKGWEKKIQRIQTIAQRLSTREGQREHMNKMEAHVEKIEIEYDLNSRYTTDVDKSITELKKEGRLPEGYKIKYDNINKILREIASEETTPCPVSIPSKNL